jgi:hypothetical protein
MPTFLNYELSKNADFSQSNKELLSGLSELSILK